MFLIISKSVDFCICPSVHINTQEVLLLMIELDLWPSILRKFQSFTKQVCSFKQRLMAQQSVLSNFHMINVENKIFNNFAKTIINRWLVYTQDKQAKLKTFKKLRKEKYSTYTYELNVINRIPFFKGFSWLIFHCIKILYAKTLVKEHY